MSIMIFLPKPPLSQPKTANIEMFNCTFCKKSFYYKRLLNRHMKRMHDAPQIKVSKKVHKCNLCEKSYSAKSSLCKHRMSIHGKSAKRTSIKCQEENCNEEFATLSKFRIHLDSVHNFADYNAPDKLRFNSLADFIKWLVQEEKNSKCKFIRPRGRFKRTSYTGIDYTCIQNKHFSLKSSKQKSSKTEDSEKTRYYCTAQILVKEFADHVEAIYFKRHYKHDTFFNSPKLIIRRKKTTKVKEEMDNTISSQSCERIPSPINIPYSTEFDGVGMTDASLSSSRDLYIESLIKRLDSIHSKLLSKTSINIRNVLKISDSLKTVEQLLDNDIVVKNENVKPSCKVKESNANCKIQQNRCAIKKMQKFSKGKQSNNRNIFGNEMYVSTSSANDHDYDKI